MTIRTSLDLTFSYSNYGFHSTMVAGESQNPGVEHLLKLANHFGIKDSKEIIDEAKSAVYNWSNIAKEYDIRSKTIQNIQSASTNIEKSKKLFTTPKTKFHWH